MNDTHPNLTHGMIEKAIEELSDVTSCHQFREFEEMPLPSTESIRHLVEVVRSLIFPGFFGDSRVNSRTMRYHIGVGMDKAFALLSEQILFCTSINNGDCTLKEGSVQKEKEEKARLLAASFLSRLPIIRRKLHTDVQAVYEGDPAAHSYQEVICCYPSIHAITNYRIAHELLLLDIPLLPRIITEMAHSETGIDIHPGAAIGEYFAIDHGTGIVIGETCIIGDHVKLYQGVTLGAKSFPLNENGQPIKGIPRHPILQDGVIIYSNATILGRITIGKNATIGGNIWITRNVEPGEKITQKIQNEH